ncbi:MAG: iron-containing alcohol dehydrogenase [Beutenbergiaceae bacterium]
MNEASADLAGHDWNQYAALGRGPQEILIGPGVRSELVRVVAGLSAQRVALLTDGCAIDSPDGDLKTWVAQQLATLNVAVDQVRLVADATADEETVEQARSGCERADIVVTVGSGTITDIGKVAAGPKPHVVLQTAASVNGYSDDESVLLRKGVKRTTHSAYPHTLIVDSDVVALAPVELNRSGLGDMISMFTAPADWYLANQLTLGTGWDSDVALLARRHGDALLRWAAGIGSADRQALDGLSTLLTLSGISMGLAGQTAPSSGMEHTVSHMLDMAALSGGIAHNLHGAQVGVTTLWASLLWRRVVDHLDSTQAAQLSIPDFAQARDQVFAAFADVDSTGSAAHECWADYQVKLTAIHAPGVISAFERFRADWSHHRAVITGSMLQDPKAIARALRVAGAPRRSSDLVGSQAEIAQWALSNNHRMRRRFNVCDFAFLLGLWNEDVAAEIIAEADSLA